MVGKYTVAGSEEEKITITLSRRGLDALDKLKESSGFGSRGRTVEEALLAIEDVLRVNEEMATASAGYSERIQKHQLTSDDQQILVVLFVNYLAQLGAFLGRFRSRVALAPKSSHK